MAQVPTISITNPDLESQDLSMHSPELPSTPDSPSVFDFVKHLQDFETEDPLHEPTLHSFYEHKSILLTGATGFIGKALLWKIVESLNNQVDKIYLLIRPSLTGRRQMQAAERLQEDILANKAFVNLKRQLGPTLFDAIVKHKLRPIHGDLTLPGLGLGQEDQKAVMENVNIVIHCAANVDGNERLDLAVKTNALGTLHLAELASACPLSCFVFLSPLQVHHSESLSDHLLPLPEQGPEAILETTLRTIEDIPTLYPDYKAHYPNTYLFSKALSEHLLAKHVDKKRAMGHKPSSMTIMRLSPLGPSLQEPLVGWADGVNGANGVILLTGKGTKLIQPNRADSIADVLPVDFAVRMILGAVAILPPPHQDFVVPLVSSAVPTTASVRDSFSSHDPHRFSTPSLASSSTSVQSDNSVPFPYICQVTTSSLQPVSWRLAYEAMRYYWTRATNITLPSSEVYFSPQGISRAKTMMNSIRSVASTYIATTSPEPVVRNKRHSHRFSRCLDKATKLSFTVKLNFRYSAVDQDSHSDRLLHVLSQDPAADKLDPHGIVPRDTDKLFWIHYFLNASYGVHYYVLLESDLRLPSPQPGWASALPLCSLDGQHLVDRQVQSDLYSGDQIQQRTVRMTKYLRQIITQGSVKSSSTKENDESWLVDLDDCLEDWSQDVNFQANRDRRMLLGKWRKTVGSNDEAVKVVVLNDKRVHLAIEQITKKAGVSKQTAMNEALKTLLRMSERTQLAFVWFAGSFLKSLLDSLFDSISIREESIRYIRDVTLGKRVVYIPVSKSILDPLLIWYIAIRYHLPVPALLCDESTSQLGPISDIYRLAGAYYVKRDRSQRSPLHSAVMAAYSQVLLREHEALTGCLEKSRTHIGKYQPSYQDGLIEMVIEATLQTNQLPTKSNASVASDSPPESPVSVASHSVDGSPKRHHRDVVLVPINITYENVPELAYLIGNVLDQKPQRQETLPITRDVVRPSESMDRRNKVSENGDHPRKCGKALIGVGQLVSIQDTVAKTNLQETDQEQLTQIITHAVENSQRKALVVTPTALISSIILYGRATGGVCISKIKELMEWLRQETVVRGYFIDWQEGEDVDAIVFNSFRLLEESKNLIIEGKEVNDDTNIRINDHADNVMTLSYYANQVTDVFLLDAFFAVVYISISEETVSEHELMDRFRFLTQMLEREFVLHWDVDEQFRAIMTSFEAQDLLHKVAESDPVQINLCIKAENNPAEYEHLMFLASLVYPTIDAYWITSCSLSALEIVPMLPCCIVPQLSQWIATHLITNRRTIYREVLSTEASQTAVQVFMALGFLNEVQAKEKLSPDAQILLHELGITTKETLIELSGQNSEGGKTPVSTVDPEGMMKALMAQIQMNRANSNMADLCQQIDSYRLESASQKESFHNAQIFQKCLKQINGILQASTSLAKKRNIDLSEQEGGLIQLVCALRSNSNMPAADHSSQNRSLRRISEAYNLK
ncbi:male sterility protein-domain-containing protein [Spinellus fusiger]|nr:male sterility protein-domain-containing protein [Spinellus fusiger]